MAELDLDRWKDAEGLAQVKEGFCFDAAHDRAFALGWPHIRILTEEAVDPYRQGLRLLKQPDFDLRMVWPRKLASALVRAWAQGQLFDLSPGSRAFRQAAEEALWNMRPLTEDEVREAVHTRMQRTPMWTDERSTESFVLLMEALSHTEWVAEAILSWLETLVFDELHERNPHPALITFQLGFLLLRLPAERAGALRERLRRVVEGNGDVRQGSDTRPKGHPSHVRSALLVLEGARAADALTDKDLRWYAHAVGQPEHIQMRATINRLPSLPDARLVFLGGPEVLGTRFMSGWSRLGPRDQGWFYAQVAPIRHPENVRLMLSGVAVGDAFGALAAGWFAERADYARPVLEELAKTHATAEELLGRL